MPTPLTNSLPIFVAVEDPVFFDSSLPVALNACHAGVSGVFRGLHVFAECASGVGNLLSVPIPVSLAGTTPGVTTGDMPVWLEGGATPKSSFLNVSVWNSQSGVQGGLPVWCSGEGVTPGGWPLTNSMPVTVWRNPANAITVFVQVEGWPVASGFPVVSWGNLPASGMMPIGIPDVVGAATKGLKVWTHGF